MAKAWFLPLIYASAVVGYTGSTVYSSIQESATAKKATQAQKDIASQQIQATQESEKLASSTAKDKLKLARARKTQTILTDPNELDEINTNKTEALGV